MLGMDERVPRPRSTAVVHAKRLMAHVRYPEDLFKVQRTLLGTYHVDNPQTFYNVRPTSGRSDGRPESRCGANQPPYYVVAAAARKHDRRQPQFQLTTPMIVNSNPIWPRYISVDSDPANYGRISVLQLTQGSAQGRGPEQVYNTITTDNTVRRDSLFDTSGNGGQVVHGNLLTLPLGESFLYVEPLYTTAPTPVARIRACSG